MEENNNKPIGLIQINRTYADSRSALRGELRENCGHMQVARLSEKIPYGVYRSENRARTAVHGPSNPTFIIPQVAAFVKYYFKKNSRIFQSSNSIHRSAGSSSQNSISSQQLQQATSVVVSAPTWEQFAQLFLIFNPNHPPRKGLCRSRRNGNGGIPPPLLASSNHSWRFHIHSSSLSSLSAVCVPHLSHIVSSMSVRQQLGHFKQFIVSIPFLCCTNIIPQNWGFVNPQFSFFRTEDRQTFRQFHPIPRRFQGCR